MSCSEGSALSGTLTDSELMQGLPTSSVAESTGLLVDRCVTGDEAAWRWLHRRYHKTAVNVLRRLGVKPHQLEDACQDVFLDVFRALPKFRQEADFKTWLYRLCIGHARIARRRAKVNSMLFSWLSDGSEQDHSHSLDETAAYRKIGRALESLSEPERVVFVLFELEGISGKDIARIVGSPEATVFRRLHDARKRFIEAIETGKLS